ncbi:MAG: diaminopimelate decarboxylase [Candidatus Omnitrophica bacterium]|nr:diaminopimelate decarboxylase [Candidatus Omnitrophota bacterium]MDD5027578.1 diaminopimelate decarboxylase [Candidatus Omnitrophota bacterium]MDD5662378.1 diaminopimelate decarboxylase [Candidatus Omnitrophota bacterium]
MHEFKYRKNNLYCEDVKVQELAEKFGTPLYVYSYKTLVEHFRKLKTAFREINPLICYSVKANSNLALLKALVNEGAGLDIVSGGELFRAFQAGCSSKKIVYASVGKTAGEIEEAIKLGILFFNVESFPELKNIQHIARRLFRRVNVALRINPDVEPKTHKYITTGKLTNKFGIDFKTAKKIIFLARGFSHVRITGLHIHIGSQITVPEPFAAAIAKALRFIAELKKEGIGLEYLNIGGGLGIIYDKEMPQTAAKFADRILPLLKKSGLKIIMEPGRFISGNAGILVARVLYVKYAPKKKFIIVDAGMNDLIRPALYEAYHQLVSLKRKSRTERADVVGPICESGDFFAKDRLLPKVEEGEYLAALGAGAYGFSMASNYNSRRRPQEVMVVKNKVFVIRKRETCRDLVRNESIPGFLLK